MSFVLRCKLRVFYERLEATCLQVMPGLARPDLMMYVDCRLQEQRDVHLKGETGPARV